MSGYIYKIVNNVNGKIYIGQHNGKNRHYWASGKVVKQAREKYGEDAFTRTILVRCENNKWLDYWEKYFITYFDSWRPEKGYNLTRGGQGMLGRPHTEIEKIKIGLGNTGKVRTEAQNLNNRNKHLGKKHSDYSKQLISKASIGCKNGNWRGSISAYKDGKLIQTFNSWESIKMFLGKSNKAVQTNVNYCTKGHLKTAYGYSWKRE